MLNQVTIQGRLTNDPTFKTLGSNSDKSYAYFGFACNRRYAGKDSEPVTDFVNVNAWNGVVDRVRNAKLHKGSYIIISGSLRSYSTEVDGKRQTSVAINMEDFEFCGSSPTNNDSSRSNANHINAPAKQIEAEVEDELPF